MKFLCRILVACMALAPLQSVQADMITLDVPSTAQAAAIQRLESLGVDPETAKSRVAVLTDQEARLVAARADELAAGGNAAFAFLGIMLFLAFVIYQQLHQ